MRATAFKLIQKLKGGKVHEKIATLEKEYGNVTGSSQKDKFTDFLKHAINTTNYYKRYKHYHSIEQCPVLTKDEIKNNYNDFISNIYQKDELIPVTTSGSYGTPFTFLLSKNKKEMQHAEVIYFSRWANFDIGVKHGYVISKVKSKMEQFIQNQLSIAPFSITNEWLSNESDRIVNNKVKVLIGYPSGIGALAKHFVTENRFYQLDGVITISEILTDDVRYYIKKAFGVNAISRYSTEELGVLAIECKTNHKHHLNNVNYIIELLGEDGVPVEDGEIGRVVVTDLHSHAMPLIRYDTGDLAIKGKGECGCGLSSPYLENLLGRELEEIRATDGTIISSMAISGIMRDVANVLQFQFIQTDKKVYEINLVTMEGFNKASYIKGKYNQLLGNDANIIINYLDDIPPLRSGKRPYILQKYY